MDDMLKFEYLNKHLPYRINSLLAPDLITHRRTLNISEELRKKCYQDSLVLEPAFEISIIFGRALLNFLGITYDYKTKDIIPYAPKKDDFTLKTIFPLRDYCSVNDEIVVKNKTALCILMKIANKSVAHLTSIQSNQDEHERLKDARMAIYSLIIKHIPEINKDAIWWYYQVEMANPQKQK